MIDVGAGRGADSLWLARRGLSVHAYDFVPSAADAVRAAAAEEGLDLDVRMLNLTEWRSVLAEGARLARLDGPRVMIARHTADATNRFGRESLARFASMALRGGGRLYLDVWTGAGQTPDRLKAVPLDQVARELTAQGARILVTRERPARQGSAPLEPRTIGGPMGLKDVAGRLRPRLGQATTSCSASRPSRPTCSSCAVTTCASPRSPTSSRSCWCRCLARPGEHREAVEKYSRSR